MFEGELCKQPKSRDSFYMDLGFVAFIYVFLDL